MIRVFRRRRAFSLIELLVVLVILALLAGIVLPKFLNRAKDANVSAAKSQVASLKTALDTYAVDSGGDYPTTQQGLQALVEEPTTTPRPRQWKGPYLPTPTIPKDPWGNEYVYESDGDSFRIVSYGADGKEGGSSYDADIDSSASQ